MIAVHPPLTAEDFDDLGDLIAGITVGIIAIPLAMALAIGSGVPPQNGLYTAAVAGIGLGLALAKRIVEAHGGRIEAKPGRERGMHFVITLPAGTPPSMDAL